MFVCLFVCSFVYLFVCLFVCLFVYLLFYLFEPLVQFTGYILCLFFQSSPFFVILFVPQFPRFVLHSLAEDVIELHTADDFVVVVD